MKIKTRNPLDRQRQIISFLLSILCLQAIIVVYYHKKGSIGSEIEPKTHNINIFNVNVVESSKLVENKEIVITSKPLGAYKQTKNRRTSSKYFLHGGSSRDVVWCDSVKDFSFATSLDPHSRYVKASSTVSPLKNCNSGIDFSKIIIPSRSYSNTLKTQRYGGLTADMGWIIQVARMAIYDKQAVEFPPYWGHGCNTEELTSSWHCFFQPMINSSCLLESSKNINKVQENDNDRHEAKLYKVYKNKVLYPLRNKPFIDLLPNSLNSKIKSDNDIDVMKQLFNWIFKLTPEVQTIVDTKKSEIIQRLGLKDQKYISVHIRGGDKIGRNSDGPLEAMAIPMAAYAKTIKCKAELSDTTTPTLVFVATDDFELLQQFEEELGIEYKVVTSADVTAKGFGVKSYRNTDLFSEKDKFEKAINLWVDMEIMKESEYFVSCMQSNVARNLHIMRLGKATNTTIRVPFSGTRTTTCCTRDLPEERLHNCFFICN